MSRKRIEDHSRVVLKFTSKDTGKVFIFKNPNDQKNYSFELLDSVSVSLSELDESNEIIKNMHYKPNVAVEQLWCRIKPAIDTDMFAIGYDEILEDLYDNKRKVINGLHTLSLGIRLDSQKDFGKNVYICSAMKPDKDFEIEWKLELFILAKKGRRYA